MKAIMLCAGKSTRTWPLTATRPKPLLPLFDSTIIEHNLGQLKGLVTSVVLVVGYKKEMIIEKLGTVYDTISINYVEQQEQLGTGHAVQITKSYFNSDDKILILNGDDIYSKTDIIQLVEYKNPAVLVHEVSNPKSYGIFITDSEGYAKELHEKPQHHIGNIANIGCYLVDYTIFNYLDQVTPSIRNEIELTSAVIQYVTSITKLKVISIKDYWYPLTYPWSYLEAHVGLLHKHISFEIHGTIEPGTHVSKSVYLGKNSIIKAGAVVEGPVWIGNNCIIGPHGYIRPDSIIMNNCVVRAEIFDSVILPHTTAKHSSYLGHSVIGEWVNIAAGTITADYRHDGKEHSTLIQGVKLQTSRKKLGAFIGDNVKTGIGTLLYPGRKIAPNLTTMPGQIIDRDLLE